MFDTINYDVSDLRPVLLTGPDRTGRAREIIDSIVEASSGTITVARRLDTITAAVVRPSTSMFVGILDSNDLCIREDLLGLIAVAPAAGVQLIVLTRTALAVPADLRSRLRQVAA